MKNEKAEAEAKNKWINIFLSLREDNDTAKIEFKIKTPKEIKG